MNSGDNHDSTAVYLAEEWWTGASQDWCWSPQRQKAEVGIGENVVKGRAGTLGDLLESPAVGMWADRDITDGGAFALGLRERAMCRGGGIDDGG